MSELSAFPKRSTDKIRYADTDRQGHVNNALFSTFLETGRVEILYDRENPLAAAGAEFVIANLRIEFSAEITWPGEVSVGTGIQKLGNSSMTLVQGIFQNGLCVARAETVIVQIDSKSRTAVPLTQRARQILTEMQVADPPRHP